MNSTIAYRPLLHISIITHKSHDYTIFENKKAVLLQGNCAMLV